MSARRTLLDAVSIRDRLAGTEMPADPLAVDLSRTGGRLPMRLAGLRLDELRPAGVLIPIIERREALTVLLTERSADLKQHAGQVSFPGGGMEPHDEHILATALRETHEEVGIEPALVNVAGYLKPMPTITGYAVTPVVGLVSERFELSIDPVEVETAFEVPLEFLMDAGNEEHSEREIDGVVYPIITFHFEDHRIWGATAGIIAMLRELLIV